jgi:hypothetical protein
MSKWQIGDDRLVLHHLDGNPNNNDPSNLIYAYPWHNVWHNAHIKDNEMKIEVGKWYKTNSDEKAYVGYEIEKGARYPFVGHIVNSKNEYYARAVWDAQGFEGNSPLYKIIEEWKEPKSGVRYMNVYNRGNYETIGLGNSRQDADNNAEDKTNRIACVRVEWKEGQFDD